jgi:hypothetical protein
MMRTKHRNPSKPSAHQDRARGRPPKYNPNFHPQAAKKFCEMGATVDQLADAFRVSISTIYQWQNNHLAFTEACRVGDEMATARVKRSYYERAVGYSYDAVKIFMPQGAKKPIYAPYREHVPAEPRCGEMWMSKHDPEKWGKNAPADGDDLVAAFFKNLFATVETKRPVEDDPRFLIEPPNKQPVTIDHEPQDPSQQAEATATKTGLTDD